MGFRMHTQQVILQGEKEGQVTAEEAPIKPDQANPNCSCYLSLKNLKKLKKKKKNKNKKKKTLKTNK